MDSSIYILGSNGFIGSHLLRHLQSALPKKKVVGLGILDLDLTHEGAWEKLALQLPKNARIVVLSGLKRQIGDSFASFEKNIQIATTLARAIERARPKRVVFFSSAAVYGEETHHLAINEQTQVNPISCYGISKFASERLLAVAVRNAGSSLVLLRPPVIYGPRDASVSYGPVAFCRMARRRESITLWGDGSELREFVYVGDCCRLVTELIDSEFAGVLNLASGKSSSFREVLATIGKVSGDKLTVMETPRSKDKVDNVFDPSLIESLFPDFQWTDLLEGIKETWKNESL